MKPTRKLAFLTLGVVVLACCAGSAFGQQEDLRKIQQRLETIRKDCESEFSNPKSLEAAKKGLLTLDRQLKDLSAGDENNLDNPFVRAHTQVLKLLAGIEARLPGGSPSGAVRRPLPIPTFPPKKQLGVLARRLDEAQQTLGQQLRGVKPDPRRVRSAITEMVLAQEELAWEAGWPYSESEAAAVKKAGGVSEAIYLQRRHRGLTRINKRLKEEHDAAGRRPLRPFVIYSPADEKHREEITKKLAELRGEAAAKAWTTGAKPLDKKVQQMLSSNRNAR